MNRWWVPLLGLFFFVALLAGLTNVAWTTRDEGPSWPELKELIAQDEVAEVILSETTVRVRLGSDVSEGRFITVHRVVEDDHFIELL